MLCDNCSEPAKFLYWVEIYDGKTSRVFWWCKTCCALVQRLGDMN